MVFLLFGQVKALGLPDTKEGCWRFYLDQLKLYFHIVLCCSPVGNTLRLRTQRFPALTANMIIDYYMPWPHEALISVSTKYLTAIEITVSFCYFHF